MRVDRAFWLAVLTGALVVALALAFAWRDEVLAAQPAEALLAVSPIPLGTSRLPPRLPRRTQAGGEA